ncbi:MAG: hypothetical protein Q8K65_00505 [Alphaproteobacteria bacterium]|nr:hypothetical protein [Alphaproteobacteria bacterium]
MRFISSFCRKALVLTALVLMTGMSIPAAAQDAGGYGSGATQGYIGQDPAATTPALPPGSVTSAQPANPAPPRLPPVFDTVRAAEGADEAQPAVADPCADFADSYDGYNMCQDRIKKIERMQDAKHRRMGTTPAPAVVATPEPEKPMTPEDAADKVRELEKKIDEKEAATEAKKAEPTTKKGIGGFNRNPDKGDSLFRK